MRPKSLPPKLHWPSDAEEAAIQQGIAADPDAAEWTDADFARVQPAFLVVPEIVEAHARRKRGPQRKPTKVLVSIRLDPDIVQMLKASGARWQTRANDLLRAALAAEREPQKHDG